MSETSKNTLLDLWNLVDEQKKDSTTPQNYKERRRELLLRDREQDIELKSTVAKYLFRMMAGETIALFSIVVLDGFDFIPFKLDGWILNILVPATITQVAYLVKIVVNYLFPSKG